MEYNKIMVNLGNSLGYTKNIPKYIVIHCSDVSFRQRYDQLNSINIYHRDERDFPKSSLGYYVGYHCLITGDKNYKCKEEDEVGAHCNQGFDGKTVYPTGSGKALSINYQSLGICIGFDGDIEMPPVTLYKLLQKQIWAWQDKYVIPNENVYFHRYFHSGKTCPGSLIKPQWLIDILKRPEPVTFKPVENMCTEYKETIDNQNMIIKNLRELVQFFLSVLRK